MEAWLRGIGCVPLFNLMEDAATAEISRAQLWQWVHHGAVMDDGLPVTVEMIDEVIADELRRAKENVGAPRYSAYFKGGGADEGVSAGAEVYGVPYGAGL